jgi:hypothetical protein
MPNKIIESFNELMGKFAFHVSDTHGLPKEIFKERYIKDGYWDLVGIITLLKKHKDFLKKNAYLISPK